MVVGTSQRDSVVVVTRSEGVKCPRCWHYHGVRENHDSLCDRCCLVLIDRFPDFDETPKVKASLEAQKEKYARPRTHTS